MTKKSEELIEKPVVSKKKPNLKISRKIKNVVETNLKKISENDSTNNLTEIDTKDLNQLTEAQNNISNEKVTDETNTVTSINREKRKIKNLSFNKNSKTQEKTKNTVVEPEEEKTEIIESNDETIIINENNINNSIVDLTEEKNNDISNDVEVEKEIQFNVSASVIEQKIVSKQKKKRSLKLNVDNVEESFDEPIIIQNAQPSITQKKETSINQNAAFFYEPSVFDRFDINITVTTPKDKYETDEITVSDEENIPEAIIEDYDEENDITSGIYELNVLDEENNNNDNKDNFIDEDLESASLSSDYYDNIKFELLGNTNSNNSNVFNDNINVNPTTIVEAASTNDSPVGKFFDSSIPSITSDVTEQFQKGKKSIFSKVSPIFKKFTYEEADIINNGADDFDDFTPQSDNSPLNIQTLDNFATSNNQISQNINDISVTAEPISTIESPVVDEVLLTQNEYQENNSVDNIISLYTEPVDIDKDEYVEELLKNEKKAKKNTKKKAKEEKQEITIDDITFEDIPQNEEPVQEYNDEAFSIEAYFGINNIQDNEPEPIEEEVEIVKETEKVEEEPSFSSPEEFAKSFLAANSKDNKDISHLSKMFENFNQTITTLSDRISNLETTKIVADENVQLAEDIIDETENVDIINEIENNIIDEVDNNNIEETIENNQLQPSENINDSDIEELLSDTLLSEDSSIDELLKEQLLSEINSIENEHDDNSEFEDSLLEDALLDNLSEEDLALFDDNNENKSNSVDDDFFKVIETLSKTIKELEENPNSLPIVNEDNSELPSELIENMIGDGKAINILINKDDIFSISILNETYEIVADFDGISVLSENIHISTPKNNFFVKIGNKYIEIHNHKDHFIVHTNFEDVEFANAINNVAFAKKDNIIELNIKEAFKLASATDKVELSMLNKGVADLSKVTEENIDESSICDNRTLLISEETQKVYLPYTINEVMKKLHSSDTYQTVQDVVENEYTVPLSTFKMPIISRFKEAYKFMRYKEKSSVYAAVDLGLELMFNSNLNPAVIRAAKDLKELNVYLDCLYENEVDKFNCFKIVYKVLPKIK